MGDDNDAAGLPVALAFAVGLYPLHNRHYRGDEAVCRKLRELECELFIVSPVEGGFAPIGLVDKFIAPKAVVFIEREGDKITVQLREEGTFLAYLEAEDVEVSVDGKRCEKVKKMAKPNTYTSEDLS